MGYNDFPRIDNNAKTSAESIHAVRGFFSQKNGFIAKDETPDYGCDLDVELIWQDKNASSKKFPIQIKSAVSVETVLVNSKVFIAKSMKTSRIAYLLTSSKYSF